MTGISKPCDATHAFKVWLWLGEVQSVVRPPYLGPSGRELRQAEERLAAG